jgi:molybdopterin converting factor small subunit
MTVKVKLFALARQLADAGELTVELPDGGTVADLRSALVSKVPGLTPLASHLFIAVDGELAHNEARVTPQSELACFPPVSGG